MSTSVAQRGAPIADEFPVLLRLPDLNAPLWEAAPAPTMEPVAAAPAVVPQSVAPAVTSESVASAAVMRLEALSKAALAPRAETNMSAGLATMSVDVVADHHELAAEPVSLSTSRLERLTRMEMPAFTRWSLVKQLTTGGVLVGGLALTYLAVMSGGSTETPQHITQEQVSLEPPLVDVPDSSVPVVVNKTTTDEKSPVPRDVPKPSPLPEFAKDWDKSVDPTDPNVVPAERLADLPSDNRWDGRHESNRPHVEMNESLPGNRVGPTEPRVSRDEAAEYRGRIGPAPQEARTQYPTTDSSTYLYGPTNNTPPDANRPGVAGLNGTIAPALR